MSGACACTSFLSTPSAGRATGSDGSSGYSIVNFYPRPPRGGRRNADFFCNGGLVISIHALRGEGDFLTSAASSPASTFLSTPSVGRATGSGIVARVGGSDFYPRPPWGGRRRANVNYVVLHRFLSTPSVGRATFSGVAHTSSSKYFYPRPPWGGRRSEPFCGRCLVSDFYPRPPWGGRPVSGLPCAPYSHFYPRPPWGGRPLGVVTSCQ